MEEEKQQQQRGQAPAPALHLDLTFVNETAGALGEYPEEVVIVRAMTSKAVRGDGYRTDAVLLGHGGTVERTDFTIDPPVSREFVERVVDESESGDTGVISDELLQETLSEAVIFYLFATSRKTLRQFDGEDAEQRALSRDRLQVRCWPLGMAEITLADLAGYMWNGGGGGEIELRVLDTAEGWRGDGKTFEKGRLILRAATYVGARASTVNQVFARIGDLVRKQGLLRNTEDDIARLTEQGKQMIKRYIRSVTEGFYPSVDRIRYYHAPRCSLTPVTELPASAYLLMRPAHGDVQEEALLALLDWSLLAMGVPKSKFVDMMERVLDRNVKHATLELFVVARIMADMCTVLARHVVYTPDHINKRSWKPRKGTAHQRTGGGGSGDGEDQETLERYLMALDTLAGDCEDVGQLSYMVAAILQCGEFSWRTRVMQLLQAFSQLYIPALHVGEASNPASESRNKNLYGDVKGEVKDTICHVYATLTPRCIEAVATFRGLVLTESELSYVKELANAFVKQGDRRMLAETKWGYTVGELTALLDFMRRGMVSTGGVSGSDCTAFAVPPTPVVYLYDWEVFDNAATALGPEMFIMQLEGTSATLPFAAPAQVLLHPIREASEFIQVQSEYEDRVRSAMEARHPALRDLAISVMDSSYLVTEPWKVNREIVSSFYLRPVAHMIALPLDNWSDVRLLLHNLIAYKTRTSKGVRSGRVQQVYGPRWGDYMYSFHTRTTDKSPVAKTGADWWWYANVIRFEGEELALIKRVLDRYAQPVRFPTPEEAHAAVDVDSTGRRSVYASLHALAARYPLPPQWSDDNMFLPVHDMYLDDDAWKRAALMRSVYTVNAHELTTRQVAALEAELKAHNNPYRFMRVHVSQFTPAMKTVTISLFYPNPLATTKKNAKLLTVAPSFQASSTSHQGRSASRQEGDPRQTSSMEEGTVSTAATPTVGETTQLLPPPPTTGPAIATEQEAESPSSQEEEEEEEEGEEESATTTSEKAKPKQWTTSYDVLQHYVSLTVSTYETMASDTSNKSPRLIAYLQENVPRVREAAEQFLAAAEKAGLDRVGMIDRHTMMQVQRWNEILFVPGSRAKLFPHERVSTTTAADDDETHRLSDEYARFVQVVKDAVTIEFDMVYINRAIGQRGVNMLYRGYYSNGEWERMRTDLVHAEASLALLHQVPGFHYPLAFDVVENRYRLDPHAGDHHMYDEWTGRHVHQHRVSTTSAGTERLKEHVVRASQAFAEHFNRAEFAPSSSNHAGKSYNAMNLQVKDGVNRVYTATVVQILGRFYGLDRYKRTTPQVETVNGRTLFANRQTPKPFTSRKSFIEAKKNELASSEKNEEKLTEKLKSLRGETGIVPPGVATRYIPNHVHDRANLFVLQLLKLHRDQTIGANTKSVELAYVRSPVAERFLDPTNLTGFPDTATPLLQMYQRASYTATDFLEEGRLYPENTLKWFATNYNSNGFQGPFKVTSPGMKVLPKIDPHTHLINSMKVVQFSVHLKHFEEYITWKASKATSDEAKALIEYVGSTAITIAAILHYKKRLEHIREFIRVFNALAPNEIPSQVFEAYNLLVGKVQEISNGIKEDDVRLLISSTLLESSETNLEKIMWYHDDFLFVELWGDAQSQWRPERDTYGPLGALSHSFVGKQPLERLNDLIRVGVQLLSITGVRLDHVVRRMDYFPDAAMKGYLQKDINSRILDLHFETSDLLLRLIYNGGQGSSASFVNDRSSEFYAVIEKFRALVVADADASGYLKDRAAAEAKLAQTKFKGTLRGKLYSGLSFLGSGIRSTLGYLWGTAAAVSKQGAKSAWKNYVERKEREQKKKKTAGDGGDASKSTGWWTSVWKEDTGAMSGDETLRKPKTTKKKKDVVMDPDPFNVPKDEDEDEDKGKGKQKAKATTSTTSSPKKKPLKQASLTSFFQTKQNSIQTLLKKDEAERKKLERKTAVAEQKLQSLQTAQEDLLSTAEDDSEERSIAPVLRRAEAVEDTVEATIETASSVVQKSQRQQQLEDDIQKLLKKFGSMNVTSPTAQQKAVEKVTDLEENLKREIAQNTKKRVATAKKIDKAVEQSMDVERDVQGEIEIMGARSDESD